MYTHIHITSCDHIHVHTDKILRLHPLTSLSINEPDSELLPPLTLVELMSGALSDGTIDFGESLVLLPSLLTNARTVVLQGVSRSVI